MNLLVGAVVFLVAGQLDGPASRWLQLAERSNLNDRQRAAYAQIARLHAVNFTPGPDRGPWGMFDIVSPKRDTDSPTDVLYRMGIDVLPQLAEALDDTTPTKTLTSPRRSRGARPGPPSRVWQVNELAALLIGAIAGRDFIIHRAPRPFELEGIKFAEPGMIAEFQKQIVAWLVANRDKTMAQRQAEQVSDAWFRNRFSAMEWLGKNKEAAGAEAIGRRLDAMLDADRVEDSRDVRIELSRGALALGQIGKRESLPQVRRVFAYLTADKSRWGNYLWLDRFTDVFSAMQLLGAEDEAKAKLRDLLNKNSADLDAEVRQRLASHLMGEGK